MNSKLRNQIHTLADKIREQLIGNSNPPIDPEIIVNKLGGKIIESRDLPLDVDAEIKLKKDVFTIALSQSLPETRRRFTIAHELGHLFLHLKFLDQKNSEKEISYQDSAYRRTEGDYIEEELQAHEFSAALLMPKELFIASIKRHTKGMMCSIADVAKEFGVSQEAATLRGKWLRVFDWN